MACRCYDSGYTRFKDSPAKLASWLSSTALEITGGTLPTNDILPALPQSSVALGTTSPQTGYSYPYYATVNGSKVTVKISINVGSVPEKAVKYTSADCGTGGRTLECTFATP
ncbi:hypothetical protein AKJ09_01675 [Labilithrix luteola]|uniref:Uncharacterized protein n=2 Tax=Labilithrix luteola TaxID=1391654 RepID=A0A0K1PNN3_9BACT|nr:hypothetical protein AKJ09_01675 [Labilithrix luteola]